MYSSSHNRIINTKTVNQEKSIRSLETKFLNSSNLTNYSDILEMDYDYSSIKKNNNPNKSKIGNSRVLNS